MQTVWILTNPAAGSGRGKAIGEEVIAEVRRRGFVVEALQPTSAAQIVPVLEQALVDGMDHLILVGGDGLVHGALPVLVGTDITVGIVASGTGNDFAKGLGLAKKRDAAIDAALDSSTSERVDLIKAEAEAETDPETALSTSSETPAVLAATVVTAGFSGRVNARADNLTFPKGSSRYTVATLMELANLAPISLDITIDDGDPILVEASFFAVANTRFFGGGMAICPEATPFDGLLDVTIVEQTSALSLARMLPTVFVGRHVKHRAVSVHRGRSIRIATSEPIWADGERFQPGSPPANQGTSPGNSHEENALRPVLLTAERSGMRISGVKKAL